MNTAVCNLLTCLTITHGAGNIPIKTTDSLFYTDRQNSVVCTKFKEDYNCKPTNNLYNPLLD